MGKKTISLKIEEYKELLDKYPSARNAISDATSSKKKEYFYIQIRTLHELQQKLGKDVIPDALIEEVKSNKQNDKSQNQIQEINNAEYNNSFLEDKLVNTEYQEESEFTDNNTEEVIKIDEEINVNLTDNDSSNLLLEDVIPKKQLVHSEEDKIPEPSELPSVTNTREWRGIRATTTGRSHLRSQPPMPCQDAAIFILQRYPAIFVADGAGSARLSHLGSQSVVEELAKFINSKESIHREILDQEPMIDCNESDEGQKYAYKFIKYAIQALRQLSETEDCSVEDLKCTLLMSVVGKHYLFWLKVGDGFIVVEKDKKLELLGSTGKGEFANQTTFISEHLKDEAIYYGFLPINNITGVAAFTDGAGETLVSMDGSRRIAGALSHFFAQTRNGSFNDDSLLEFLKDETVWASPKGFDDRGLALLARL
ncbi:PP2C family serine/threonine-protein phosphatase [Nostoc sp. FACHB-190]|uniref:PP2C family serine/threonine-protein phosphatase n=1 Tax=Nostoc sp. FACHB-190 TaxID=2692838 RepID=UPI00168300A8|nr:PP2C family serine/threonine-protein phosphatase [Nostoc sp. FACHB-190]MBD2303185.1 protein phosphatase 2C domain-containing protein [Nostoc sp. FACHB-190]